MRFPANALTFHTQSLLSTTQKIIYTGVCLQISNIQISPIIVVTILKSSRFTHMLKEVMMVRKTCHSLLRNGVSKPTNSEHRIVTSITRSDLVSGVTTSHRPLQRPGGEARHAQVHYTWLTRIYNYLLLSVWQSKLISTKNHSSFFSSEVQ